MNEWRDAPFLSTNVKLYLTKFALPTENPGYTVL